MGADGVSALLARGAERRHTHATLMNLGSSRSHLVLTVHVALLEKLSPHLRREAYAPGELIDKITILEIKSQRLADPSRRFNVTTFADMS